MPVPVELETVTLTAALVAEFPAASLAMAVMLCVPLAAAVVYQEVVYGEAVSAAPTLLPSIWNCTLATPTLSEAFALSVTLPETVAPLEGAVMLTVGGVVSLLVTVKLTPLLATPPTVTTTLPVVAPLATGATMLVALQLVGVAATPLNFTVLVPCVAPKFAPAIVTDVPATPDVGFKLVMLGDELVCAPALPSDRNAPNTAPHGSDPPIVAL